MWQDLLRIPLPFSVPIIGDHLTIHGFGLMLVIGFLAGMELARFLSRRAGINPELFANAALIGLLTGIVGARLSHVLENLGDYTRPDQTFAQNLSAAMNITSGGLTYYGGFLLAFPTLLLYAWRKKIPIRIGMDIVAPCLMVGLAFGRIGCFLNGCCYGATCDAPWAVSFPYGSPPYEDQAHAGRITPPAALLTPTERGERLITRQELEQGYVQRRNLLDPTSSIKVPIDPQAAALASAQRSLRLHPAQLYSALTAFLLAGLLVTHFGLPHAPGRTFALMLMLEAAARFSLELVRSEPAVIGRFSFSMVISIPLAALGVVLWIAFGQTKRARANRATVQVSTAA